MTVSPLLPLFFCSLAADAASLRSLFSPCKPWKEMSPQQWSSREAELQVVSENCALSSTNLMRAPQAMIIASQGSVSTAHADTAGTVQQVVFTGFHTSSWSHAEPRAAAHNFILQVAMHGRPWRAHAHRMAAVEGGSPSMSWLSFMWRNDPHIHFPHSSRYD